MLFEKLRTFAVSNIKDIRFMKTIRIYCYYSRFYGTWAHLEAYSKRDALKRARVIDPYTKLSDLSLLIQNGR